MRISTLVTLSIVFLALCQPSLAGKEKKKVKIATLFNREDSPAMTSATFLGVQQAASGFVLPNHSLSLKSLTWSTDQEFESQLLSLANKFDFIIGFERSSYLESALRILKENNLSDKVILVSSGSTSTTLSLDDNAFRVMPNDAVQARALAFKIVDVQATSLVTLCIDDTYGNLLVQGVLNELKTSFSPQAISDPISYNPETEDFSTHLAALEASVQAFLAAGSRPVVLYKGFFEVAKVFAQANDETKYPGLNSVQWIGTDTTSKNPQIVGDAAVFADKVRFVASDVAVYAAKTFNVAMVKALEEALQRQPTSTEVFAFDAGYLVTMVTMMARRSKSISEKVSILRSIAGTSFLVGGGGTFDENGDRAHARYEFDIYTSSSGWLVDGETFPFFSITDNSSTEMVKREALRCNPPTSCSIDFSASFEAPAPGKIRYYRLKNSQLYKGGSVYVKTSGFKARLTKGESAFAYDFCPPIVGHELRIRVQNTQAVAEKENASLNPDDISKDVAELLKNHTENESADIDLGSIKELNSKKKRDVQQQQQVEVEVRLCR